MTPLLVDILLKKNNHIRCQHSELLVSNLVKFIVKHISHWIFIHISHYLCLQCNFFQLYFLCIDVQKESLTQIAAQYEDQTFSVYIKPRGPIGSWALENTHLNYDNKSLTLYYKGEKVTSKKPHDALEDFVEFLKSFSRPIILAAHFCHQFDAQILYKQLVDHQLWEDFSSIVNGFADTCLMFQKLKPSLKYHKLDALASKCLPAETYSLHNAVDDTRILNSLVEKQGKEDMLRNDFFHACLQTKQYFPKGRAILRFR
ncbi:unnamed protein product [Mytilus coruscus]|uniref:Exonuclease domain-containing protein n=1 Tax=Mytilus coruscus TaxID=42192 RepID=A0A6J8CW47_MYTCO|nr:unnamed protein product [Mytilus coruscus]